MYRMLVARRGEQRDLPLPQAGALGGGCVMPSFTVGKTSKRYLRSYRRLAWAKKFAQRWADKHEVMISIRLCADGQYEVWQETEPPEAPA